MNLGEINWFESSYRYTMIFKINVFGKICKKCAQPFKPGQWVVGKSFTIVDDNGDLKKSTGYIDFYHYNKIGCDI